MSNLKEGTLVVYRGQAIPELAGLTAKVVSVARHQGLVTVRFDLPEQRTTVAMVPPDDVETVQ